MFSLSSGGALHGGNEPERQRSCRSVQGWSAPSLSGGACRVDTARRVFSKVLNCGIAKSKWGKGAFLDSGAKHAQDKLADERTRRTGISR